MEHNSAFYHINVWQSVEFLTTYQGLSAGLCPQTPTSVTDGVANAPGVICIVTNLTGITSPTTDTCIPRVGVVTSEK